MSALSLLFWVLIFIVAYTYVGYGFVLYLMVKIKKLFGSRKKAFTDSNFEPAVTLFIAAYNEKDYVAAKMKNSLELDYPKDKLEIVWVTDGSDDGTPELACQFPEATVYHLPERNGKIGAMNRGMKFITTPIVVFSDANTMLGKESIRRIVKLF